MRLSAQTARNQMMQGQFGESTYDPKSRKLAVRSDRVRKEKTRRDKIVRQKRTAVSVPPVLPAPAVEN
jgi:hypothetical protein